MTDAYINDAYLSDLPLWAEADAQAAMEKVNDEKSVKYQH